MVGSFGRTVFRGGTLKLWGLDSSLRWNDSMRGDGRGFCRLRDIEIVGSGSQPSLG
jgi:hypothetical protein